MLSMTLCPAMAQNDDIYNSQENTGEQMTTLGYCVSYEDLQGKRWTQADSVMVVTKSRSKQMWWGGKDFKFESNDKTLNKLLKDKAVAVMYHDTLLLNTCKLKDRGASFGKGYARAYPMTDGRLLMTYFDVMKMNRKSMTAGMFGLVGALVMSGSSSKDAKQDVCYIVTPGEKKVTIVDDKVMKEMLADHPDLLEEYMQVDKKSRSNAEVVMPLMKKLGVIG